jgi:hypothetical protein
MLILLALALVLAASAPLEKTLGSDARIVYFHGAWVWAAILTFFAAALTGIVGLVARKHSFLAWSQALGRSGICFWIGFLPLSLLVMQLNWNGLFLDEPRFRIPFNLAVAGLLLQLGLSFLPDLRWTALGNILFAAVWVIGMNGIETILHPQSPILNTTAREIQVFFIGLVLLISLAAWQLGRWWLLRASSSTKRSSI